MVDLLLQEASDEGDLFAFVPEFYINILPILLDTVMDFSFHDLNLQNDLSGKHHHCHHRHMLVNPLIHSHPFHRHARNYNGRSGILKRSIGKCTCRSCLVQRCSATGVGHTDVP